MCCASRFYDLLASLSHVNNNVRDFINLFREIKATSSTTSLLRRRELRSTALSSLLALQAASWSARIHRHTRFTGASTRDVQAGNDERHRRRCKFKANIPRHHPRHVVVALATILSRADIVLLSAAALSAVPSHCVTGNE